jgi:hypothetical protein
MATPVLDIIFFVGSYVVLLYLRQTVMSMGTHTIPLRILGFVCSWLLLFSVFDWFLNFILMVIVGVGGQPLIFYRCFAMLLVMVVALRLALSPPEGLEVHDVLDFLRESVFFNNYIRRKDSDFREEYNRMNVRKIHEGASDKPIEKILPSRLKKKENRFVGVTTEMIDKDRQDKLTTKVREGTEGLRKGEVYTPEDAFRLELMNSMGHEYFPRLKDFKIDPSEKTFSMLLPLPDILEIDPSNEKQMNTIIAELYQIAQVLQSQVWLQPYTPYFKMMKIHTMHSIWDDLGRVHTHHLLTITFSLSDLRRHDEKLMPADSIKRFAKIEYR